MSDASVAAASSVAVAIITAVVGPAVLARYKARREAALLAARGGRPSIPARPGARRATVRPALAHPPAAPPAARPGLHLRAIGLTPRADPAPARRVVLREGGPRAVLDRLAAIPPLSRRAVAHELFVGRWADWGGVVHDVRESESGYAVHVVDPDDGGAALLDFAADERPTLESLREGDRVRYAGRVTGAEDGFVILDSPTINRAE
ncbi:hypothetical protein tb265_09110 [Gemmatimonadetes bacterium T265]|nr:hypothetical protein tb265_09110 [Gemmatimonadetes bacterium T265]